MEYDIKDKSLIELYTKGKSKKIKIPVNLVKKFIEKVNRIEAADTINDLRYPPSMRFEKLAGFKNRYSIRLNIEYRLEFEIEFEDKAQTRGKITIICISKHYE